MSEEGVVYWCDLGLADVIPDGGQKSFVAADIKICVVRDGETFYALRDLCSHGQAFLSEGSCDFQNGVIECPLHGGLFDLVTGEARGKPARKPVAVYPCRILEGHLHVSVQDG
jgi:nitrite reductase/ring-hydroxylating ferredoxin subunit